MSDLRHAELRTSNWIRVCYPLGRERRRERVDCVSVKERKTESQREIEGGGGQREEQKEEIDGDREGDQPQAQKRGNTAVKQ